MLLGVRNVFVWKIEVYEIHPQILIHHLQEDVDDGSIAKEVHDPKEEEGNANNVDDQWMLGWKLSPVGMDKLEDILRDAVEMGGALGVDQVVLGVHVDAMLRLPSHLCHGKWRTNLNQTSSLVIIIQRRGQTACERGQEV